ncbi:hypothetical protein SUGI_0190370 [Cryptomeria japonica]|uniref:protein ENHANCED DISEASE RESISTANCE 2 n=1 Tax=Cryptomeria japonica TaxID=3369 RepID=UPI002408D8F4|nr:protein ENHANCED DISEASE RESISTANCE 2 [Cryptomeria japonica]GLJ12409.1 hypothetical protein SUGI_0190370 [Cryptomeria japonica]
MAKDWKKEVRQSGPLREVELESGVNGWSSPPGRLFTVRGENYLSKKQKVAAGEWLMSPLGMDWLRSGSRLDNVLARSDNRVMAALRRAQDSGKAPLKTFVLAVNLQVPGRSEHHSAVFYYAVDEGLVPGSLLYRFVNGDDAFRNSRFKLVNRIVRGPWIVRATVGNHAACLLGKALTCRYLKGQNYLEIDVDVGSSALANAVVHLALGYVNSVSVDMAFIVEAQAEEELPEKLIGAVRIQQIEMSSALYVENVGADHNCGGDNCGRTMGVNNGEWRKRGRCLRSHGSRVEDEAEAASAAAANL